MSCSSEAAPVRRDQSIAARRAARQKRYERERRIVGLLDGGHSVSEIAAHEGLTQRRMRAVVQAILARRLPPPPAGFAALQVGRLNEALSVSFNAMSGANLQAVDRVIKVVRELDRYHLQPEREAALPDSGGAESLRVRREQIGPAGNVAANV